MSRLACVLVLFAMGILALGCSPSTKVVKNVTPPAKTTQYILHVDELFSPVDRAIVIDSFMEWERDTHGVVSFALDSVPFNSDRDEMEPTVVKCTADVYVVHANAKDKIVKQVEKEKGYSVLGFTMSNCKNRFIVFVMDRLGNPTALRNVGVHEAGHLIGLDHIPVPKESIMFPSMDLAAKCITKLDMKQFCMLHKCDWRQMITCDD